MGCPLHVTATPQAWLCLARVLLGGMPMGPYCSAQARTCDGANSLGQGSGAPPQTEGCHRPVPGPLGPQCSPPAGGRHLHGVVRAEKGAQGHRTPREGLSRGGAAAVSVGRAAGAFHRDLGREPRTFRSEGRGRPKGGVEIGP